MDHVIPGSIETLLPHMVALGLASLCEDAGQRGVRVWWSDDVTPQCMLRCESTMSELAAMIYHHASAYGADSPSWVRQTYDEGGREIRLYDPRGGDRGVSRWQDFVDQRDALLPSDRLSRRFIAALGEPAWWALPYSADRGASRWDMRPRNGGFSILTGTIEQAVEIIAKLSLTAIEDVLSGAVDVPRQQRVVSSGFSDQSTTSAVLMWCALWGLSVTSVLPQRASVSAVPAMFPVSAYHPDRLVWPIWTRPVSVAMVRAALAHRGWPPGVRATLEAPIVKAGSASAPERIVLQAQIVPISG